MNEDTETVTGDVVATVEVEPHPRLQSDHYTAREAFEVGRAGTYKLVRVDDE